MGEMADYTIDLMWDELEEEREDGDGPARTFKTCSMCKTPSLHWEWSCEQEAWRLYSENGKIHKCERHLKS